MTLSKTIFRQNCLQNLQKTIKKNTKYKDFLVNKQLRRVLKDFKNKKILFYYPLQNEVDIRKTLLHIRKSNEVFLPFMEGESFKMVTYRLPLRKKKFGILEAGNTLKNNNKIDIAIVPIIGVDGNLQRVGFGKGMYDRFFMKLKKKPYTIFIQRELCYTKKMVCDDYDIGCDLLLTSKTVLAKKNRVNLRT